MNTSLLKAMLFGSVILVTSQASTTLADPVAVVVHPSNTVEISGADITRIFLGKSKSFPDGGNAIPVDQSEGSDVRDDFSNNALKKSVSQLKAYWSKLVFTGKGSPPKEVGDDAQVLELVASNPNLIGYVRSAPADGSVRVVMNLD